MSGARGPDEEERLQVGGREIVIPHPDKLVFPTAGFTRRDVATYYLAAAPALLPHLAGRPVTLVRFPDGVDAPGWYQVNCPGGRPPWLPVAELRGHAGQPVRPCLLDDAAALLWAVGRGALEVHPVRARIDVAGADGLVVDLDPAPPAGLLDAARVALQAREALGRQGLPCMAKASGGRGLHLLAPLDPPWPFDAAVARARALAAGLAAAAPAGVADREARAGRDGKVLVDWRQNQPGRSLIAPWSLRAAAQPLVAAPLGWDEIERAVRAGDEGALRVAPAEALHRLRAAPVEVHPAP